MFEAETHELNIYSSCVPHRMGNVDEIVSTHILHCLYKCYFIVFCFLCHPLPQDVSKSEMYLHTSCTWDVAVHRG